MDGPSRYNRHYIVSQIDIELWAREQRRRWYARTFGAPLRKLARVVAQAVLRALFRLVAYAWQGRRRARWLSEDGSSRKKAAAAVPNGAERVREASKRRLVCIRVKERTDCDRA